MNESWSDEELLGYFSIHSRTERCLFSKYHILRLCELAGQIPPFEGTTGFLSVGPETADHLIKLAKERLNHD